MPEVISKYPEVTLEVLKGAGARCAEGIPPQILTKCPEERFCSLPTGEMCVYGIDEIEKMTQIRLDDLVQIAAKSSPVKIPSPVVPWETLGIMAVVIFTAGIFLGKKLKGKQP